MVSTHASKLARQLAIPLLSLHLFLFYEQGIRHSREQNVLMTRIWRLYRLVQESQVVIVGWAIGYSCTNEVVVNIFLMIYLFSIPCLARVSRVKGHVLDHVTIQQLYCFLYAFVLLITCI
jgi:hypothetical protein